MDRCNISAANQSTLINRRHVNLQTSISIELFGVAAILWLMAFPRGR
jgi:hypothetical protein